MAIKKKTFYAYQLDLHYLDESSKYATDAVKWDATIVEQLFLYIDSLTTDIKNRKYKDSWMMYLDHLTVEEHYIFGKFLTAEYGTVGELVHADSLAKRKNPKQIREGETQATYFYVRKSDGLVLIQGNLRLNRPKFEEYIEALGQEVITRNSLTYIQVCTLVENSFFDNISELNTVHKVMLEVSKAEAAADENEAVRILQNEIEEVSATNVKLEFEAKYQREGMKGILPLVRKYKDQKGVTKIVVKGKLSGAEKVIKLDESQEKYIRKVEVDNNNQPMLSSVEEALCGIGTSRRSLRG